MPRYQEKPHFFKIFFPEIIGEKMGIPPAFWRHIGDESPGSVTLAGPSGSIWNVDLVRDANGMSLQNGWQDFVADHSVSPSDLLLFRYEGNLHFTVMIFDVTACEKEDAFLATSSQDLAIVGDSNARKKALVSVMEDCTSPLEGFQVTLESGSQEGIPEAMNESSREIPNDSDQTDNEKGGEVHAIISTAVTASSGALTITERLSAREAALDMVGTPATSNLNNVHEDSLNKESGTFSILAPCSSLLKQPISSTRSPTTESSNQGNLITTRKAIPELLSRSAENSSHSRNTTLQREPVVVKEEAIELPIPPNPQKISGSILKGKVDKRRKLTACKTTSSNKSSGKESSLVYPARTYKRRHSPNSSGEQVTVKVRMATLISKRRPVTEEEVKKAYEKAKLFKSECPSTMVVMRESYVYYGFYMNLPSSFARVHLPSHSDRLKLWDPNGKFWIVNYVVYQGRAGLSARWGAFALANNLEQDDICVFELINKNEMQVHIFRVVEEFTPLAHAPASLQLERINQLMLNGMK